MMSEPILTAGHEPGDRRTHLERINPGDNPAYAPGAAMPRGVALLDRGAKWLCAVLAKSFHNDRLYRPGEMVELFEDEIGPQHRIVRPPTPDEDFDMTPEQAERLVVALETIAKMMAEAKADRLYPPADASATPVAAPAEPAVVTVDAPPEDAPPVDAQA